MAAERPTVLAIDGVIRDVVEKSGGGLYVPPGNSAELASAVLKYYQDAGLMLTHGKNAREYVRAHFERLKIAERLEDLFLKVTDGKRPN